MNTSLKITSALISVFDKEGLGPIVEELNKQGVTIYSTGGTEKFIRDLGMKYCRGRHHPTLILGVVLKPYTRKSLGEYSTGNIFRPRGISTI